jgi:hypothetical protein
MTSRRSILCFLLLIAVLGGILLSLVQLTDAPTRPVTSMPRSVFYSAGDQWFEFYSRREPDGTGWVLLPEPINSDEFRSSADPFLMGFVSADVCRECHPTQYEGFRETAHFRTSSIATQKTVLGDFTPAGNRLGTKDPNVHFEMLAEGDRLFQRVVIQQDGRQYEHRRPFDIVTGSGNHGQTFLYWEGDRLCQLPISYFSESGWVNSPGRYRDGTADFARGVGDRCLDCHATYFDSTPVEFNRHDRTNFILGVTCVRCHGPGWAHVQYHRSHPAEAEARYIVNPSSLSQQRANEVCAQCHSGIGRPLQPAFSYRPGEPLEDFLELDMRTDNPENDDPHAANQLLRLMKSRCFQESENMTCATCHDPHQNERADQKLFNQRCAACHAQDACKLAKEYGSQISDQCVECHMPSRRDAEGAMQTSSGELHPLLRDHLIKGWPDVTERVIAEMHKEPR